jgi:protein-S-isoprenylcysteine O-methyltransferase Ste14
MNKITPSQAARVEELQARFGQRVAADLNAHLATQITSDIGARLRFAREQAVRARPRTAMAATAVVGQGSSAALGGPDESSTPWWLRLSALVPLVVLLAGLAWIDHRYDRSQIEAAAEVDAAILSDVLPPDAYRDPGFVEYLKTVR